MRVLSLLALGGVAANLASKEERPELLEDLINGKITAKQISDRPDLYVSASQAYASLNMHEHVELAHSEKQAFLQFVVSLTIVVLAEKDGSH